ncbi:zinc chelation protein SecC [Aliikangiella marina]|uniref:Zinc chelation protein SecC n=1 Tax=Aliikangiella marina TaxID=1712262 RepID=A0A545T4B5_9GAMM|nr:YchJ family metal-binding protein [Aliikangiella marina]TQV71982.1 zinc chelation protein SecC [Aliikangiella marina]TQV72035.1 zinc chelation protein SecC [Aliikangiella marina]
MRCYCCSGKLFADCCEPILTGTQPADAPEALMRSRYSAFCSNNACYLVSTHWPVEPDSRAQIQQTIDSTKWLGLKVIRTDLHPNTLTGSVEFVAFFDDQGVKQLHEKSSFVKQNDKWFYTSGEHLPPIKIGRNDECFCGSGKKFKRCHIAKSC